MGEGKNTIQAGFVRYWDEKMKIAVTAAILILIFFKIDVKMIAYYIDAADISYILISYLIAFFGIILQIARWRVLFIGRANGFIRCHFIGMFYQLFTPAAGQDIIRGYFLSKKHGSIAYSSSFTGRIIGMSAIILFIHISIIFEMAHEINGLISNLLYIFSIFLFLLIYLVLSKKITSKLRKHISFLDGNRFYNILLEIRNSMYNYRKYKIKILIAFIISILIIFTAGAPQYFIIKSLGYNIPFGAVIFYCPIIFIITIFPISLNGLGIREYLYFLFFNDYGIDFNAVISISFFIYLFQIVCGAIGYCFLIVRKK